MLFCYFRYRYSENLDFDKTLFLFQKRLKHLFGWQSHALAPCCPLHLSLHNKAFRCHRTLEPPTKG